MNIAILQGRAVKEPELEQSERGKVYSRFRLACERPYRGKDVPRKADYFTIVCFGKWAQFANNHIAKGALMTVLGRLEQSEYIDRDGKRTERTSVIVDKLTLHEWLRKHREIEALSDNFDDIVPREITDSLIKQIDIDDEDIPEDLIGKESSYID